MRVFKKALLTLTSTVLLASTAVGINTSVSIAAPAVSGKQGCVLKVGESGNVMDQCEGATAGGTNSWELAEFVTADEINNAFNQFEDEYKNYVDDKMANDPKDAEQDARLDANDAKNAEQDSRLDAGDQKDAQQDARLDDHDKSIADINDGAVFYNRDPNGVKTGGVTFNDGTGDPVGLGNVAAGKQGTDAVNVDQLTGALDGLGGGAHVNADGTISGPTYNIGGNTYNNVGDALAAQGALSVQYVADENGNPTNTVALIGDGTGAPVTITNVADGVNDSDAANYGQVKDRVAYDRNEDGSRSNSITLIGGAEGPVTIHNVQNGVHDTDAANTGQVRQVLHESKAYTDQEIATLRDNNNQRFEALTGKIHENQKEARAGIAGAMAAAGLRYDDRPGKASIAGGFGGFKGATAFAAGVGYTTEDGKWRLNTGVSHSFSDNATGWNAAASFTFN